MGIGRRLKEARKSKHLTQEELAEKIGVTKGAIANYEKEISHPKENLLYALFDALEVEPNFLFQDCVDILSAENNLSPHEIKVALGYRNAPKEIQDIVDSALNKYMEEPEQEKTVSAG